MNNKFKIAGIILIVIGIVSIIAGILVLFFSSSGGAIWIFIASVFINVLGASLVTHKPK